jgi:hypothetical protein
MRAMDHQPAHEQSDPTLRLPRDVYYQLVHTLRAALPPIADTPDDVARRDNAAIAQVASLRPANADEASIAAQYVAANAHAMDCLRLAQEHRGDPSFALKCGAQAASMMRQARGARSLLLRVQTERRKLEADSTSADRAAWTEHCAIGLMAKALADAPRTAATEQPTPAPTEAPQPKPTPKPRSLGRSRSLRGHLPTARRTHPCLARPAAAARFRTALT